MRAAIYLRQSSDPQDRREGVDRQERVCRELAKQKRWKVVETYVDNDVSAFARGVTRPGFEAMLDAAKRDEFDVLIAMHPDRIARRVADLARVEEVVEATGLQVETVDGGTIDLTSSAGIMAAQVVGSASEFYSRSLAEKVTRWHTDAAAKGRPAGTWTRPYGYQRIREHDDEGRVLKGATRLVIDPAEAEIVRECVRRLTAGEAASAVVRDLDERGIPTVTGKGRWRPTTLLRMLTHPRLAGWRTLKGERVARGEWDPLLTDQEQEALIAALGRRDGRTQRAPREYVLKGLVRCGECGEAMWGRRRQGRTRYECRGQADGVRWDGCGSVSITAEPLEELVVGAVLGALAGDGLAEARQQIAGDDAAQADALAIVERFDLELAALADDYAEGSLSRAAYMAATQRLEQRSKDARKVLGDGARGAILGDLSADRDALEAAWEAGSLSWRNELLATVLEAVTVAPATVRGGRFDTDRITVEWRF